MNELKLIAQNTFRECTRSKALYTSLVLSSLLMGLSLLLGIWAVFYRDQMMGSFSLSVMTFSGVVLSIFLGIGIFHNEIGKKTILPLLSHALPRWKFIAGKYIGLQVVLALHFVVLALVFTFTQFWVGASIPMGIYLCIFFIYLETALISGAALFFSTFASPFLSGWFSIGLYIMGYLGSDFANKIVALSTDKSMLPEALSLPGWTLPVAKVLQIVIPDLNKLNYKIQVFNGGELGWGNVSMSIGYALCFIIVFLTGSCLVFQKRELA